MKLQILFKELFIYIRRSWGCNLDEQVLKEILQDSNILMQTYRLQQKHSVMLNKF